MCQAVAVHALWLFGALLGHVLKNTNHRVWHWVTRTSPLVPPIAYWYTILANIFWVRTWTWGYSYWFERQAMTTITMFNVTVHEIILENIRLSVLEIYMQKNLWTVPLVLPVKLCSINFKFVVKCPYSFSVVSAASPAAVTGLAASLNRGAPLRF